MSSKRNVVLALLLVLCSTKAGWSEPLAKRYFVVVWGYEAGMNPTSSHTFAAFYRGDDLAAGEIRPATISWLPATGFVRPFGVERGKNFSLGETLALAKKRSYRLGALGPYEVTAQTYSRALSRIRLLNSGKVSYTMINGPKDAMNCIEAAGSVAGPVATGMSYGLTASALVASHLARAPARLDGDAASRLKLGRYAAP